jgi:ubiquitin carboxyl-terminal hydrolase 14
LKEKLVPLRHRIRELEGIREERKKESRSTKGANALFMNTFTQAITAAMSSETGRASGAIYESDILRAAREDNDVFVYEMAHRDRERKELEELVNRDLRGDVGCNITGLYDLVGEFLHGKSPRRPLYQLFFLELHSHNRTRRASGQRRTLYRFREYVCV